MAYSGDAPLGVIMDAWAAWERAELTGVNPAFQAFSFFPSQADLDQGSLVPFTIHVPLNGSMKLENLNGTRDKRAHLFNTYLVLSRQIDEVTESVREVTRWIAAYRDGYLKHRHLLDLLDPPDNGALITDIDSAAEQTYEFGSFTVFGMDFLGLRFPCYARTRNTVTSAS